LFKRILGGFAGIALLLGGIWVCVSKARRAKQTRESEEVNLID